MEASDERQNVSVESKTRMAFLGRKHWFGSGRGPV
jgi:hypothetical protein